MLKPTDADDENPRAIVFVRVGARPKVEVVSDGRQFEGTCCGPDVDLGHPEPGPLGGHDEVGHGDEHQARAVSCQMLREVHVPALSNTDADTPPCEPRPAAALPT